MFQAFSGAPPVHRLELNKTEHEAGSRTANAQLPYATGRGIGWRYARRAADRERRYT